MVVVARTSPAPRALRPAPFKLVAMLLSKRLHPLAALPPLFLAIPIYSIWWSGRDKVHGT